VKDTAEATLVITAPQKLSGRLAIHSGARLTVGVLVELAVEARSRLVLASPYVNVTALLSDGVLADAIKRALGSGVEVEIASAGTNVKQLRSLLRLNKRSNDYKLKLFQPHANAVDERQLGSHAKFCISDSRKAYLGSANFTTPGLGGHLEMGVLVEGKLALQISEFWSDLKTIGLFVPVT
jgi:phosphatidylserine/phosphatidylglycerophosphate/cardiolipin synthase-like enzyme